MLFIVAGMETKMAAILQNGKECAIKPEYHFLFCDLHGKELGICLYKEATTSSSYGPLLR